LERLRPQFRRPARVVEEGFLGEVDDETSDLQAGWRDDEIACSSIQVKPPALTARTILRCGGHLTISGDFVRFRGAIGTSPGSGPIVEP
jgi:hypothetical protein